MTLDRGVTSINAFPFVLEAIFLEIITEKRMAREGNQGGERSGKNIAGKRDNGPEADQPSH